MNAKIYEFNAVIKKVPDGTAAVAYDRIRINEKPEVYYYLFDFWVDEIVWFTFVVPFAYVGISDVAIAKGNNDAATKALAFHRCRKMLFYLSS